MDVEAAELGVLLEPEQAVAAVALEVQHLELREKLHALQLVETYFCKTGTDRVSDQL